MVRNDGSGVDLLLHIKNAAWRIIPRCLFEKVAFVYFRRKKLQKKIDWLNLNVYVTSRCDLNCVSCTAFAPIADDYVLDVEKFESDCKRLAELDGNKQIKQFRFSGGETLRHPRLFEILGIARNYFPYAKNTVITNGIILSKCDDDFWVQLKSIGTDVIISNYPIKLNIKSILATAKKHGIHVHYYRDKLRWYKQRFDETGSYEPRANFLKCRLSIQCAELRTGKIATCQSVMKIQYFNSYFHKNIEATDADVIDIYKVKSIDEILEFICKPIPFCKYCNVEHIPIEWGTSKKDISEWT